MRSKTALGKKLLQVRKEKSFTQGDVAAQVGVSRAAISQFELGDTVPSFDTLQKLSRVLLYDFHPLWNETPAPDELGDEYIRVPFWPAASYPYLIASVSGEDRYKDTASMLVSPNECQVLALPGEDYSTSYVIEIKGDSMGSRYPNGARYVMRLVFIDQEVLTLARGVYLFLLKNNEPFFRRVISTIGGMLRLRADTNGEEMELEIEEIDKRWRAGTLIMFKLGQAIHLPAED